jgi:hypothetical protein
MIVIEVNNWSTWKEGEGGAANGGKENKYGKTILSLYF